MQDMCSTDGHRCHFRSTVEQIVRLLTQNGIDIAVGTRFGRWPGECLLMMMMMNFIQAMHGDRMSRP